MWSLATVLIPKGSISSYSKKRYFLGVVGGLSHTNRGDYGCLCPSNCKVTQLIWQWRDLLSLALYMLGLPPTYPRGRCMNYTELCSYIVSIMKIFYK